MDPIAIISVSILALILYVIIAANAPRKVAVSEGRIYAQLEAGNIVALLLVHQGQAYEIARRKGKNEFTVGEKIHSLPLKIQYKWCNPQSDIRTMTFGEAYLVLIKMSISEATRMVGDLKTTPGVYMPDIAILESLLQILPRS